MQKEYLNLYLLMRLLLPLVFTLLLLTACRHTTPEQKALLSQAEIVMPTHPDRALHLLKKISNFRHFATSDRALYALLMTQALDKCDSVVASDTLIRIATDYYGSNDPVRAGYAWFYRARCENNQGNAQGQVNALLKAEEFASKSNNYRLQGFIYGDKAKMYQMQNQLDSMLCYNMQAYSSLKKAGDKRNCVVCLLVIGYSHYLNRQYETALKYSALALKECDSSEPLLVTSIHRQQCLAYYCLKDYQNALRFARLSAASSDAYDYCKQINLSMIFNKMNNIDSACYYLRQCRSPHEMAPEFYQTWLNVCAKQFDSNAVAYYSDKLVYAKDSLYKHNLRESFAGLERKYKYEGFLSQNKSLIIANQQGKLLVLLLFLFLSIGGVGFALYRNRQNKRLLEKQLQLNEKQKELSQRMQERASMLQDQINIQQGALSTLNKLKFEIGELSRGKSTKIAQSPCLKKGHDTTENIIKHVVENVDLLYNHISKRLVESFPDLLENDVIICCFLLAGFDNVTIYTTLNLKPNSYNVKRTGLRKKLRLSHETNLTEFLAGF
ncbi:MAG: hypothetical protein Q8861_04985 [Bacteroidota bacterium]|nr:hypothetical protein [Bacteroidota bacterium]